MSETSFEDLNTNLVDTSAFKSPEFNSQYTGAAKAGIIRGAYHFARPDVSSGAEQAKYFLANGGWYRLCGPFIFNSILSGGWSGDGITLPGALDIECEDVPCVMLTPLKVDLLDNPYGKKCYGLSASAMVSWIQDFSDTYHSATKR